jgi:hypothetical protein
VDAILASEGAAQGAIDAAAEALAAATDGLAVADAYSAYGELAGLLLGAAKLDGRDYTAASWANLRADGGEALLNIALRPARADQASVSLILSHLDIARGAGGGEPELADAGIDASVAVTALRIYSRFDINRDGAVTLVDVDIARAGLGARRAPDGSWESERLGRCDLDGNSIVEIADLTLAMAKYESTVP